MLPRLEQIYPGAVRAIGRFAALAAVEDDFMVREAERFLENNAEQTWVGLRLRSVSGVHPAILRRAIHELTGLGAEACLAVEALCRSGKGRISLENGLTAEKTGQSLYLLAPPEKAPLPVPLPEEGVARLGSIGEICTHPCAPEPVRGEPFCQVLDRQSLVGACVRTRQAGDVIRPLGMSGEQKLSDYLINRRVDRPMRDAALLVARGRRVLWVAGVGMSEDARLREGSRGIRLEARENISKWRKNHGDVQGSGQNTDWRG